ncbi:MAG: DNA polymerase I [Pseudanabaenaceae cyanobacterium]
MMTISSNPKPLLLLVDGYSLAFRSYYAFAHRSEGGLRTSTGVPTSVCYGFLKSLLEILEKEQPQDLAIAFDDKSMPTFRHAADANYKANRGETPQDFIPDALNLQRLLTAMALPILIQPGYEADDIIGTLAVQASGQGYQVKILSGDRDLFQLIDDEQSISVLLLGQKDKVVEYRSADVFNRLGIFPRQVVDYKALCGDASDNIPGVRGIGEKSAVKLLQEYGSLERILSAIPEMKGSLRKKLAEGIEAAKHSQFMARIALDVPISFDPERFRLKGFSREAIIPLLQELELKSFIKQIDEIHQKLSGHFGNGEGEVDDALWFDFASTTTPTTPSLPVPSPQLLVQIIDTPEKLQGLVEILKNCTEIVAWDTETTSLQPHDRPVIGIGCCWGDGLDQVVYIPLTHLDKELVVAQLKPILEDSKYAKVCQNAKFDRLMLRSLGIELQGVVFDTMLASYVLDPEASHNLENLALTRLNLVIPTYKELLGKAKSLMEVPVDQLANYCGTDVFVTRKLQPVLQQELAQYPQLLSLFQNLEIPLEPVLADMEWVGVSIDRNYLQEFAKELEQDLGAIAQKAQEIVGKKFNLNSPKQLSEILVELLGEKFTQKSRKSSLGYATDVKVLEKIVDAHPLIPVILEHRTLAKLKSTYVDALPGLIHPATGRIHTDFNQAVTATGRLSSSNPNLQNIPIRTAFSRRIRQAFVPQPAWLLLAADYSQIELRILAHLSGEPELIRAYNENLDVHTLTAQILLEKEEVTSEERRLAKVINYGVIYGMGAQKFSRETGIPVAQAKEFIAAFNKRYSRVFAYLRSLEEMAEQQGYVTTILGRRRYFREMKSATGLQKANYQRAAINAPIQGTSADIIKLAMVKLHQLLKNYQSRLILQVHDELVFEVLPSELEELQPQIKHIMETVVTLSVPLVVDIHVGQNWMEAK